MDSRSYRAHTAGARCAAGDFVLMGHKLAPLSLCHFLLLEQLFGEDLYDSAPGFASLAVRAEVCGQARPHGQFGERTEEERCRLALVHAATYDLAEEQEVWWGYLDACFLARPFTRHLKEGGGGAELRAPFPMVVLAFLLRHTGLSRAELWHELPVSEALWLYEAVKEQVTEVTGFAATDEPERPATPEEQAAEALHHERARKILQKYMGERAAAMKLRDRKARAARLKEIEVAQAEALRFNIQHPTSNVQHPSDAPQATGGSDRA